MIRPNTALRALPSSSTTRFVPLARSIQSSAVARLATPTEDAPSGKAPQMKEFKIYRWVRASSFPFGSSHRNVLSHVYLRIPADGYFFSHCPNCCCCWIPTDAVQNPDTPQEKPYLQSYKIDLSKCGPMVLDAVVRLFSISQWSRWWLMNVDQDQIGDRPILDIPEIMQRGYLWKLLSEHRRACCPPRRMIEDADAIRELTRSCV